MTDVSYLALVTGRFLVQSWWCLYAPRPFLLPPSAWLCSGRQTKEWATWLIGSNHVWSIHTFSISFFLCFFPVVVGEWENRLIASPLIPAEESDKSPRVLTVGIGRIHIFLSHVEMPALMDWPSSSASSICRNLINAVTHFLSGLAVYTLPANSCSPYCNPATSYSQLFTLSQFMFWSHICSRCAGLFAALNRLCTANCARTVTLWFLAGGDPIHGQHDLIGFEPPCLHNVLPSSFNTWKMSVPGKGVLRSVYVLISHHVQYLLPIAPPNLPLSHLAAKTMQRVIPTCRSRCERQRLMTLGVPVALSWTRFPKLRSTSTCSFIFSASLTDGATH